MSISALALAATLATLTGANAADLGVGGNCCADLEERIAELEATTARKGNRKVSLTVTGWVSQQLMIWDDGVERNAYISDIGSTLNSHVNFQGSAQISSGVSAGYVMQIEGIGNENLGLSQSTSNTGKKVDVIQSFWFVKSDTLGKISLGLQSSAADNAALLPDGSGSLAFANYIMYDINGFGVRFHKQLIPISATANLNWGSLATCQGFFGGAGGLGLGADCDGVPNNNIRYDTPTFGGFSGSASWGEDDVWALSGRYAADYNGIKVSAAIGYFDTNDSHADLDARARGGKRASAVQVGGYIQHVPTGLFVYGAYAKDYNDRTGKLNAFGEQQKNADNWYLKAGIRQKWNHLGHSVVYGEYGENEDKMSNLLWVNGVLSSNLTQWGLGFVQEIDAAAMSIFANYRHYSAEGTIDSRVSNLGKVTLDDAELFKVGALINF